MSLQISSTHQKQKNKKKQIHTQKGVGTMMSKHNPQCEIPMQKNLTSSFEKSPISQKWSPLLPLLLEPQKPYHHPSLNYNTPVQYRTFHAPAFYPSSPSPTHESNNATNNVWHHSTHRLSETWIQPLKTQNLQKPNSCKLHHCFSEITQLSEFLRCPSTDLHALTLPLRVVAAWRLLRRTEERSNNRST